MDSRRQLYLAAMIGASLSYLFNVLAFTGEFSVVRWGVFMGLFLLVTVGFERLIAWADAMERE
jgi:hypothetical protein